MRDALIASFILRFVQETLVDPAPPRAWRGMIRHVQTGQEFPFTHIEDALAFIGRYVEIEAKPTMPHES